MGYNLHLSGCFCVYQSINAMTDQLAKNPIPAYVFPTSGGGAKIILTLLTYIP